MKHSQLTVVEGGYEISGVISREDFLGIARQLVAYKLAKGVSLKNPCLVKETLPILYGECEQEIFSMILLDTQHKVITRKDMFFGTIDAASVYPREIVKLVLEVNAGAVILVHNHPSGRPTPSQQDKTITQRIKTVLNMIDVQVLDHFIVAGSDTYSFAEHGIL
jgi:DNA repair protein RadC